MSDDAAVVCTSIHDGDFPITIDDWETTWTSQFVRKFVWRLAGGFTVESVDLGFPNLRADRYLCLSTQVGCPVKCLFCATGSQRFQRNLTAREIHGQFMGMVDRSGLPVSASEFVTALYYGMGEPSLNAAEVDRSIDLIAAACPGVQFSISTTCANLAAVQRWVDDRRIYRMQFSLHAPDDARRDRLMRVSARVGDVIDLARRFGEARKTVVPVNYILLRGFNDADQDLDRLGELLAAHREYVSVKLTMLNDNEAARQNAIAATSVAVLRAARIRLEQHGLKASVQDISGCSIGASCGQLRYESDGSVP